MMKIITAYVFFLFQSQTDKEIMTKLNERKVPVNAEMQHNMITRL